MIYQIRDWDSNFENDRSRRVEKCSFVCVPNKQHGMGFLHIIQQPDGAAIYGIWACLLGACSQQKHRDGWLTSDGEPNGRAWGVDDLVVKIHRPKVEIERALEVLCSEPIGWIIRHEKAPEIIPPVRRIEKGKPANNGHRQLWEIKKDIATIEELVVKIRRGFGQEKNGDGKWSPALTAEQKPVVEIQKEKIKRLEAELAAAPI